MEAPQQQQRPPLTDYEQWMLEFARRQTVALETLRSIAWLWVILTVLGAVGLALALSQR